MKHSTVRLAFFFWGGGWGLGVQGSLKSSISSEILEVCKRKHENFVTRPFVSSLNFRPAFFMIRNVLKGQSFLVWLKMIGAKGSCLGDASSTIKF